MSRDLPTGIRKVKGGFQAYVWIVDPTKPKGGSQPSQFFPAGTSLQVMKEWRMKRKLNLPDLIPETSFADDARVYLARDKVQRMPTRSEREKHIAEWSALFGRRDRKEIKPHEIQAALDAMRARMSAASVNKRRTALMDLWTTLDGRHQANPVKATHVYEEPHPEPRAPALSTVIALLDGMPTLTDYGKKCKARLQVIAWTGWPHAMIKQLEPADLPHWKKGTAFIARRKKGKGARARWLPLLPQAKRALLEFHKADAYGDFSNSTLHKRVVATCTRLKLPKVRPYDLRHFFLTLIAVITRDERAVMELGLISTPDIARRYTEAATDPRVQAAVKAVAGKLPRLVASAEKAIKKGRKSAVPCVDPAKTVKPQEIGDVPRGTLSFTRRGSVVRIH